MNKGKRQYLMHEAAEIAKAIVTGQIAPNEGCVIIGDINHELEWPDELWALGALAHEQTGHENLGITAESCVPDIIKEAKQLIERRSQ